MCFSKAWAQDITQNQALDNALASMFQPLDLDSVKTGFLLDRAVEAVDIRKYNGTLANDNYVDLMSFRNTLITLNSAIVNSTATSFDGNAITNSLHEQGVVNLGVAAFKYNYIASNALTNNLISYQNGVVDDVFVNGIWQDPYSDDYVFVFAPSVPIVQGSSVTYQLTIDKMFTNLDVDLVNHPLEFDNGNGVYVPIDLPYESTCSYSAGDKHLRLRLTLSNNTVLESHAKITILGTASNAVNMPQPDFTQTVYTYSGGQQISALVTGKSCNTGTVTKPFVFVEGFDDVILGYFRNLSQLFSGSLVKYYEEGYFDELLNRIVGRSYGDLDFYWFYNTLPSSITDNYDVFYVDLKNPEADISDNAILLQSALEWINGLKCVGAERNIVMGHSMGGLIARYALCDMEASQTPHETDVYVSFDSPHMGVNVPLGLQYAFRDLFSVLYGNSSSTGLLLFDNYDPVSSYLMSVYSCPSAKQMMYYYVEPDGSMTTNYHTSWQTALNTIGFPRGDTGHPIENLSVVNGGIIDTTNSCLLDLDVSIGNDPLITSGWLRWLLHMFTKASNLEMSLEAYRNNGNGGIVGTSAGVYKKKFGWLPGLKQISLFGPNSIIHYSPGSSVALDYVKSSVLDSLGHKTIASGNDYIDISISNQLPFIPAASALAITDYELSSAPTPHQQTPFDAYYLSGTAQHHSHLVYSYFNWIINQASCSISGPKGVIEYGDVFSVNAPASYNNPTWTSSEPSSFSLNNNILTFTGNNSPTRAIRISYNNSGNGSYMSKRRTLLTGFPEIIANVQHVSGNSYEVSASCTYAHSSLQSVVDSLAADGAIKYIWGIKTNGGNIDWADTTSSRSRLCTALQGDLTHIYVKMYSRPGSVSDLPAMVEIDRRTNIPFFYDPKETIVGEYFGIPNYTQITPFPIFGYLVLWHNSDYNGTPVAPDNIKIGKTVIPLASSYSASIDGETKTVYCFDFMDCSGAQAAEAWARDAYLAGDPIVSLLTIYIRNGTTDLYCIDYPFIPAEN